MRDTPPTTFDGGIAAVFADYGITVRGYVRYQLTRRNLEPFLAKKKMRVLDVGGGSGPDAAWLAALGHSVTLVEPSKRQRQYAVKRFNFFLSEAERQRITVVPGTLDDLEQADRMFDLALIHGVTMYQPRPENFVRLVAERLQPGGLLSLVEKGYYGAEARAIRGGDYADLRSLQTSGYFVNNLKQTVHAFKPEELQGLLAEAHTEVLDWFGIRLITDDIDTPVSKVKTPDIMSILDAEYRQGHDPAIRAQGQLLQFIARKKR